MSKVITLVSLRPWVFIYIGIAVLAVLVQLSLAAAANIGKVCS